MIQKLENSNMKRLKTCSLFIFFLIASASSITTDPFSDEINPAVENPKVNGDGDGNGDGGGFIGSGSGFHIHGLGNGFGHGILSAGYGNGGYAKEGVSRPEMVCNVPGPCYQKKLRCPDKCFSSYRRSGKGYGASGSGGGCTMDCNEKCIAYC